MSLSDYIDWDIDEEKRKNRVRADRILKDFSDVEGLGEVLSGVLGLMDLEIYNKLYESTKKNPEELTSYIESAEELLTLRQVKLAVDVLKKPPLYIPPVTGVIIASHFQAAFLYIGGIHYAHTQRKLGQNATLMEHAVLERLMVLLDDFDSSVGFHPPDEDFYRKLKSIKWSKGGKRLHKKIYDILFDINDVKLRGGSSTFSNGENFTLTFLAACCAVVHGRDKILPEDVVMANKTYLKLLNTDIEGLEL